MAKVQVLYMARVQVLYKARVREPNKARDQELYKAQVQEPYKAMFHELCKPHSSSQEPVISYTRWHNTEVRLRQKYTSILLRPTIRTTEPVTVLHLHATFFG